MLRPLSGEKKSNTHLLRPHCLNQLESTILQSRAESAGHYKCDRPGTYSAVSSSRRNWSTGRDGAPIGYHAYGASRAAFAKFFVLVVHPLDNSSLHLVRFRRRPVLARDVYTLSNAHNVSPAIKPKKSGLPPQPANYSRAPGGVKRIPV